MTERLIVDQEAFEDLCRHIRDEGTVAFDTEFVSEFTYQPELCLLQLATARQRVAVDPFAVRDLASWWAIMADDQTTVVVHGGQAEVRFCLSLGGERPRKLVDIQLAEGLRSRSYPLGYAALVNRALGRRVHGKETRTDWRRRPLSPEQIQYALEDVQYVLPVWERQRAALAQLGRLAWAEAEFERMVEELAGEQTRESWRRLSGIHRLNPRELAVARELLMWREREAARRDRPLRRLLRDDLIIDLARRQPKTVEALLAVRDMNRTEYRRSASDLLQCIECGLGLPEAELPEQIAAPALETGADEHVLGQLLGIALANRCAEMNVSKQLVGTSADLRHLVRWHVYQERSGPPPRLAAGWRADVCGDLLTNLLDGRVSLRVADPESDHPLVFEGTTELGDS